MKSEFELKELRQKNSPRPEVKTPAKEEAHPEEKHLSHQQAARLLGQNVQSLRLSNEEGFDLNQLANTKEAIEPPDPEKQEWNNVDNFLKRWRFIKLEEGQFTLNNTYWHISNTTYCQKKDVSIKSNLHFAVIPIYDTSRSPKALIVEYEGRVNRKINSKKYFSTLYQQRPATLFFKGDETKETWKFIDSLKDHPDPFSQHTISTYQNAYSSDQLSTLLSSAFNQAITCQTIPEADKETLAYLVYFSLLVEHQFHYDNRIKKTVVCDSFDSKIAYINDLLNQKHKHIINSLAVLLYKCELTPLIIDMSSVFYIDESYLLLRNAVFKQAVYGAKFLHELMQHCFDNNIIFHSFFIKNIFDELMNAFFHMQSNIDDYDNNVLLLEKLFFCIGKDNHVLLLTSFENKIIGAPTANRSDQHNQRACTLQMIELLLVDKFNSVFTNPDASIYKNKFENLLHKTESDQLSATETYNDVLGSHAATYGVQPTVDSVRELLCRMNPKLPYEKIEAKLSELKQRGRLASNYPKGSHEQIKNEARLMKGLRFK